MYTLLSTAIFNANAELRDEKQMGHIVLLSKNKEPTYTSVWSSFFLQANQIPLLRQAWVKKKAG